MASFQKAAEHEGQGRGGVQEAYGYAERVQRWQPLDSASEEKAAGLLEAFVAVFPTRIVGSYSGRGIGGLR